MPFPREAAIEEINKNHLAAMLDDSARIARNMGNMILLKLKWKMTLKYNHSLKRHAKNTDYNVETAQMPQNKYYMTKSFGAMSKEELEVLTTGEMDDAIYAFADGVENDDPMISNMGIRIT